MVSPPSGLHQVRLRHQRGGDQDQQVRGRQLPVQLGRRRQEDGLPRPIHGTPLRPQHEQEIKRFIRTIIPCDTNKPPARLILILYHYN